MTITGAVEDTQYAVIDDYFASIVVESIDILSDGMTISHTHLMEIIFMTTKSVLQTAKSLNVMLSTLLVNNSSISALVIASKSTELLIPHTNRDHYLQLTRLDIKSCMTMSSRIIEDARGNLQRSFNQQRYFSISLDEK